MLQKFRENFRERTRLIVIKNARCVRRLTAAALLNTIKDAMLTFYVYAQIGIPLS